MKVAGVKVQAMPSYLNDSWDCKLDRLLFRLLFYWFLKGVF
ncbi:hypothetical protein D356_01663 [Enterococcus faecium SD2A-2]|uniref:Uncharacterized protein n=1 Tax=Enterococcus faecium SD2A-2 TaxID=1244154 RepID=A0AB73A8W7_ENTFC|nr:hypothetical protein D356_01663 [Enterococcus faecium SD2A-2]